MLYFAPGFLHCASRRVRGSEREEKASARFGRNDNWVRNDRWVLTDGCDRGGSLGLLEDVDFCEGFQVFDDEFERDGAVFGGDAIADLLRVEDAVHEVQSLVGVFFSG